MRRALLLLLLAAPAFGDQAMSADGSFSVETPQGWRAQAPKPGYLVSLAPPEGKGGFSLAPAPAEVADEAGARASLQSLSAQLGQKFKTTFGGLETLDTPQPGRMLFVSGTLGGKQYLLGYYTIGGRWYRVDVLADGAGGAANYALSSFRAAGLASGTKRKADVAAPSNGQYSVGLQKGWNADASTNESEVLLKTKEGDDIRISAESAVADEGQAEDRARILAAGAASDWKAKFSDLRTMEIGDHKMFFEAGHHDGEMIDTVLVGVFKSGPSFFRLSIQAKAQRPLDLAQLALDRFALKGQALKMAADGTSSTEGGPAAAPADTGPTEGDKMAARMRAPKKEAGLFEGYHVGLMLGMAVVPVLLVAGVALFGRTKSEPPPSQITGPPKS
jgi:hypothetical protein